MAEQVFPTKGNLINTKKSLELARLGFELLDRKRNIIVQTDPAVFTGFRDRFRLRPIQCQAIGVDTDFQPSLFQELECLYKLGMEQRFSPTAQNDPFAVQFTQAVRNPFDFFPG